MGMPCGLAGFGSGLAAEPMTGMTSGCGGVQDRFTQIITAVADQFVRAAGAPAEFHEDISL